MSSEGIIVLDESACVVNVAKFFLKFTSCRVGAKIMLGILERIARGEGTGYLVVPEFCRACDRCRQVCPTGAARGTPGNPPYRIELSACINCGACFDACPFGAIERRPGRKER